MSSRAWPMVMYCINPRYKYQNNRLIYDRAYLSFFFSWFTVSRSAVEAASRECTGRAVYSLPLKYTFFSLYWWVGEREAVTDKLKFPVNGISRKLNISCLHVKTEYIYILSIYSRFTIILFYFFSPSFTTIIRFIIKKCIIFIAIIYILMWRK